MITLLKQLLTLEMNKSPGTNSPIITLSSSKQALSTKCLMKAEGIESLGDTSMLLPLLIHKWKQLLLLINIVGMVLLLVNNCLHLTSTVLAKNQIIRLYRLLEWIMALCSHNNISIDTLHLSMTSNDLFIILANSSSHFGDISGRMSIT